jgi:hypothetical protein
LKSRYASGAKTVDLFLVQRGLVSEKDTYIAMDDVGKRVGNKVFINVPKPRCQDI